jgi:hypothetical protein
MQIGQIVFYKATEAEQIYGRALYSMAFVLLVDGNGVDLKVEIHFADSDNCEWRWVVEGTGEGQVRAALPT